jgi:hypothetical protein
MIDSKNLSVYCLLSFLFFYSVCRAEDVGILGGFNLSAINGGELNNHRQDNGRLGLNAGIFCSSTITNRSSFQCELLLISKGAYWCRPVLAPSYSGDYVSYYLLYLELPIQYACTIIKRQDSLLDLLIGPYFALKLNAHDTWKITSITAGDLPYTDLDNDLKSFDYGLSIGIRLFFGKSGHFIAVQLDWGLSCINKSPGKRAAADFRYRDKQRLRTLLLNFGYAL